MSRWRVDVVAVRVGVAGQIEPAASPSARRSAARRADGRLACSYASGDLSSRNASTSAGVGRQAGEIERDAPQQSGFVGFRRRLETFFLEARQNESIDVVARPVLLRDARNLGPLGGCVRPVRLPLGAFIDPALDGLDLGVRQRSGRSGRRHAQRLLLVADALVELAAGGVAWLDDLQCSDLVYRAADWLCAAPRRGRGR